MVDLMGQFSTCHSHQLFVRVRVHRRSCGDPGSSCVAALPPSDTCSLGRVSVLRISADRLRVARMANYRVLVLVGSGVSSTDSNQAAMVAKPGPVGSVSPGGPLAQPQRTGTFVGPYDG